MEIGKLANNQKSAAGAFARVAAEPVALPLDELAQVNMDLQHATRTILGVTTERRSEPGVTPRGDGFRQSDFATRTSCRDFGFEIHT